MGDDRTAVGTVLYDGDADEQGYWVRVKTWGLVTGHRWLVAGLIVLGIFTAVFVTGLYGPIPVQRFLTSGAQTSDMLIEFVGGIITLLSIVLAINQRVLKPETGSFATQQERLSGVMEHREAVAELLGLAEPPVTVTAYMQAIMDGIVEQAAELHETATGAGEGHRDLQQVADQISQDAAEVQDILPETDLDALPFLIALMRFGGIRKYHDLRWVRNTYRAQLADRQQHRIDTLLETLYQYEIAKKYFKTTYLQDLTIDLSRSLVYTGVPVLTASILAWYLIDDQITGILLGLPVPLLLASAAIAVATVPLALLVSYVARLSALSESTTLIQPFLREEL